MRTIITYEDNMANFGSVRLRAFQVGKALQQHLPVEILPLSACISNKHSLFIVVKPRNYGKVRKLLGRGNTVIVDLLDTVNLLDQPATLAQKITGNSPTTVLKQIDAAIFCSDKISHRYQHYLQHPELCQTIYHHWDGRFQRQQKPVLKSLKVGYFGLPRKAYLADILKGVDFQDMRSYEQMNSDIFNQYNAHYILKPDQEFHQFEPLTKIATAAFAQSPVLSMRGHEEELLGADYPYYIPTMDELDILATIRKMEQTYREDLWQDAIEIMESAYHKTSLSQIGHQYLKLIKRTSE